ncbi:MAG: hypothetical protein AAFR59_00570 [Bacteroidota bacterium]
MKPIFFLPFLLACTLSISQAQEITEIEALPNEIVEIEGNLSEGNFMSTLAWAWNSSVACFPETQKTKFTGHHVLYQTQLPRYSEMVIKVIPKDPKANFSLYAYEIGTTNEAIVPELTQCVRCEVDHKWDYARRGQTQDHTRTVTDILAINNPYKVIIGVVGAEGLTEGAYTLEISLKSR